MSIDTILTIAALVLFAAADLGSLSYMQLYTSVPTAGTYVFKCNPPRIYKI